MNFPTSIDQIWVFGSHARGDSDKCSDVDILMVSGTDETNYVTNYFAEKYAGKIDVSYYSYDGLTPLIDKGSLFANHLKKEAIPLYQRSSRLKKLLIKMPEYSNHLEDLHTLELLVDDVKESLHAKNNSFIFDSGVLGTAIRNTAIIMSNYLGHDDFSPWAPLRLRNLECMLTMPLLDIEYRFLQDCRRLGERGGMINKSVISQEQLLDTAISIGHWQHNCVNYIFRQGAV